MRTIDPPSFISGSAFCTVNRVPLTLVENILSNCSSVIDPSGGGPASRIGEQHVDRSGVVPHD